MVVVNEAEVERARESRECCEQYKRCKERLGAQPALIEGSAKTHIGGFEYSAACLIFAWLMLAANWRYTCRTALSAAFPALGVPESKRRLQQGGKIRMSREPKVDAVGPTGPAVLPKDSRVVGRRLKHRMVEGTTTKSARVAMAMAALLLFASGAAAAPIKLPPLPIESYALPNGLKVLLEEDDELPVVTLEVWYHVGARNEGPGEDGYAHLLEHLMFDGTRDVPSGQIATSVIQAGGELNAYTRQDVTVFWETIPSGVLERILWLEADRMRDLRITSKHLDNERRVVEEERRMRFENTPYGTMLLMLYDTAFRVAPYHWLPIGDPKDLDRATVGDIKKFYNTYYRPNNATLLVVGDFKPSRVKQWIESDFGPLPPGPGPFVTECTEEPKQRAERTVRVVRDVSLPAFIEGYRMPPDGTPDSYPLELLINVLSQGETSLIYRSLIGRDHIAVEADADADFTQCPNLFFIQVVMNSGSTAKQGEAAVQQILNRLRKRPLTARQLDRAKNQILSEWVAERETTRGRAGQLGEDGVVLHDPALTNTEINRVLRLTPKEVQAAARKYFVKKNLTLVEFDPSAPAQQSNTAGLNQGQRGAHGR